MATLSRDRVGRLGAHVGIAFMVVGALGLGCGSQVSDKGDVTSSSGSGSGSDGGSGGHGGGSGGHGGGGGASSSSSTGQPSCGSPPCIALAEPLPVGAGARDLLVTDCDGDKHVDIIVANSTSSTISVLKGHGDGAFDAHKTFSAGEDPWMLAEGDFNGDGKPDLAIANFLQGASVVLGDGACGFGSPAKVLDGSPNSQPSIDAHTVAAGDLDGDGHDDIVAHALVPFDDKGYFAVLFGKGDGTFEAPVMLQLIDQIADIAIVDLNGDGILDLAGVSSEFSFSSSLQGYLHVVLGAGGRTFSPAAEYPIVDRPEGLAVADFNGDGHLDVVTPGKYSPCSVSLLQGNGDGSFKAEVTFPVAGNQRLAGIAAGDLDADGSPDVVVAVGSMNAVAVLLGSPNGQLGGPAFFTTGDNPTEIDAWEPFHAALADLNEDGALDVAVTNYAGNVGLLLSY